MPPKRKYRGHRSGTTTVACGGIKQIKRRSVRKGDVPAAAHLMSRAIGLDFPSIDPTTSTRFRPSAVVTTDQESPAPPVNTSYRLRRDRVRAIVAELVA